MSLEGTAPAQDAAWVVLETSTGVAELGAFCRDLERLYRINPFLEFKSWQQRTPDHFTAEVLNHSNQQRTILDGVVVRHSELAFHIDFKDGIKKRTRFEVRPAAAGARLTITDEYLTEAGSLPAAGALVDRSLHAWGVAIKSYLQGDRRWGRVPLYSWYMRRAWLPMKPAARRIMFLILVIGLADLLLIALGFAVYWLEAGR